MVPLEVSKSQEKDDSITSLQLETITMTIRSFAFAGHAIVQVDQYLDVMNDIQTLRGRTGLV